MSDKTVQTLLCGFLGAQLNRIPPYFIYDLDLNRAYFATQYRRSKLECFTVSVFATKRFTQLPQLTLVMLDSKNQKGSQSQNEIKQVPNSNQALTKSQVGLLKSLLQKCVRRGKTELGMCAASLLLDADPLAFLRRLPVIMIEDARLMSELPVIVWMMCALGQKRQQWRVAPGHRQWMLSIVGALCDAKYVDRVGQSAKLQVSDAQVAKLSDPQHRALLWSLKIRAGVGGMKSDVRMMYAAVEIWSSRFQDLSNKNNKLGSPTLDNPLTVYSTGMQLAGTLTNSSLRPEDWELAAVDFHCTDIIQHLPTSVRLEGKDIELDRQLWRKIIWHFSSAVTSKTDIGLVKSKLDRFAVLKSIYDIHVDLLRKWQQVLLLQLFYHRAVQFPI